MFLQEWMPYPVVHQFSILSPPGVHIGRNEKQLRSFCTLEDIAITNSHIHGFGKLARGGVGSGANLLER